MSIYTVKTVKSDTRLQRIEERNYRKTKGLNEDEVAQRLNKTKGHQASKWGRKWILRKINGCEAIPYKDKQNATRKTNAQLVDIGIRFLGLDDDYFKKIDLKKNIRKSSSHQLYCWVLQHQKTQVKEPCVYVIGNQDFVKVGFSTNVQKRLKSIQTGCPYPLSILKVFKGLDMTNEKVFHQKLKKHKTVGEWFIRNEEVEKILELI